MRRVAPICLLAGLLFVLTPNRAEAYIGPGAGFAVGTSLLAVFAAFFSAFVLIISWPVRFAWRAIFRRRPPNPPRCKRVVILGLDGLDHGLTAKLLAQNQLPNLARLRDQGCFLPLGSTLPPISPVAWSSFQTGVNPGKHNIFDFVTPDERTYLPKLSSVEIRPSRRVLRLGKFVLPLGKPDVRLLRKSKPFWSVLSDYGVFNSIIRIPITFPPERLNGVQLSAMCVPDIRGSQGTFSHFTTRVRGPEDKADYHIQMVVRVGNQISGELLGPPNPLRPDQGELKAPFKIVFKDGELPVLHINGKKHELHENVYTDWVRVRYHVAPLINVHGICKFLLLGTAPYFELYVTPVNIDPEQPALPIGYPAVYSVYLANRHGPFSTLGLAEDTTGLNDCVLNDDHFVQQCRETDREREAMFFDSLDKVSEGLCVCVFDASDRMQHMFWRYLDETHPARPKEVPVKHATAIEDLYRRMDDLVGRTMAKCEGNDTHLMVLSDHGFNSFRRAIDLNRWLEENGYLFVDESRRHEEHLAGIDWSRTRAFALGLTGIFVNLKGKFAQGIVEPGAEADRLRDEIARILAGLLDPDGGTRAIKKVYQAQKAYRGPYKDQAPDLIVGYDRGYRVSWEAAVGKTTTTIFHSNTRAWSGDHCVDPSVVPGVLFSNRPITEQDIRLLDVAPTVLEMFGVPVPEYMDGRAFAVGATPAATSAV